MAKIGELRTTLRELDQPWEPFLLEHSGLPGRRANIELGLAAAAEGRVEQFLDWLSWDATKAPTGSPEEFLAFCGVLGLGELAAAGDEGALLRLREMALDTRWRVREAVAMALHRVGRSDFDRLLEIARDWATGHCLERRAAAAAVCEPDLLGDEDRARAALDLLDRITGTMPTEPVRRSEGFRVLRLGLGYCWSVAVTAFPEAGKPMMERWLDYPDHDVAWVMRHNLGKRRLMRMDPEWVEQMRAKLEPDVSRRGVADS